MTDWRDGSLDFENERDELIQFVNIKRVNSYSREGSFNFTVWTRRDGSKVNLCDMSVQHLINTRAMVKRKLNNATDGYEREIWQNWVMAFKVEVNKNKEGVALPLYAPCTNIEGEIPDTVIAPIRCHCGKVDFVRTVDFKRGWGTSCSKRCAARKRKNPKLQSKILKQGEIL